jgi:hypothetical protein
MSPTTTLGMCRSGALSLITPQFARATASSATSDTGPSDKPYPRPATPQRRTPHLRDALKPGCHARSGSADRNPSWASGLAFECCDMPVVDNRQIIPRVQRATRGKHL